jgi:hypothetical protein
MKRLSGPETHPQPIPKAAPLRTRFLTLPRRSFREKLSRLECKDGLLVLFSHNSHRTTGMKDHETTRCATSVSGGSTQTRKPDTLNLLSTDLLAARPGTSAFFEEMSHQTRNLGHPPKRELCITGSPY